MIILKLFVGIIALFAFLVLGLALSVWFNIRHHLNPFLKAQAMRERPQRGGDVIEGEFRVIKEEEE